MKYFVIMSRALALCAGATLLVLASHVMGDAHVGATLPLAATAGALVGSPRNTVRSATIAVIALMGAILTATAFQWPIIDWGTVFLAVYVLPPDVIVLPWVAIGLAVAWVVDAVSRESPLRCSRWSVCGAALASTVTLALLVSYPSMPDSVASTSSRWVDFEFYRHDLDALVRQQHRAGQRLALAVITIDGFITIVHGIAYDESGEMALPPGRQSARWRAAAAGSELDSDTWSATRLYGNYFWWDAQ